MKYAPERHKETESDELSVSLGTNNTIMRYGEGNKNGGLPFWTVLGEDTHGGNTPSKSAYHRSGMLSNAFQAKEKPRCKQRGLRGKFD